MKVIERAWNSYRQLLPADASEAQLRETRQAFYAGAAILFEALMLVLDPGDEATEADMQRIRDVHAELRAFGQSLDRRLLGPREH